MEGVNGFGPVARSSNISNDFGSAPQWNYGRTISALSSAINCENATFP